MYNIGAVCSPGAVLSRVLLMPLLALTWNSHSALMNKAGFSVGLVRWCLHCSDYKPLMMFGVQVPAVGSPWGTGGSLPGARLHGIYSLQSLALRHKLVEVVVDMFIR